jgi:hypothetical protein
MIGEIVDEVMQSHFRGMEEEDVVTALAAELVDAWGLQVTCEEDIRTGVAQAMEELDEDVGDAVLEVVQAEVSERVAAEAKHVALVVLKQLAANSATVAEE